MEQKRLTEGESRAPQDPTELCPRSDAWFDQQVPSLLYTVICNAASAGKAQKFSVERKELVYPLSTEQSKQKEHSYQHCQSFFPIMYLKYSRFWIVGHSSRWSSNIGDLLSSFTFLKGLVLFHKKTNSVDHFYKIAGTLYKGNQTPQFFAWLSGLVAKHNGDLRTLFLSRSVCAKLEFWRIRETLKLKKAMESSCSSTSSEGMLIFLPAFLLMPFFFILSWGTVHILVN